jgi:hypothetical protein
MSLLSFTLSQLTYRLCSIETPSEISKSILVRCDPCKRRRTTCSQSSSVHPCTSLCQSSSARTELGYLFCFLSPALSASPTYPTFSSPHLLWADTTITATPNGSKRCLCCVKKGTQCTYGKQAESNTRGKGRRFGLRR